jgi:PAS domain S-box-containing protein
MQGREAEEKCRRKMKTIREGALYFAYRDRLSIRPNGKAQQACLEERLVPMPNGREILLVEDEALIALAEKISLEKFGYIVITATTGEAAVVICLNENAIDLVLMDIDLGKGIDGTIAASIILRERNIPIIFLSSHTEAEVVKKTEEITNYGYIVKSSSSTVLDASIKMAFKLFDANSRINQESVACLAAQESLSDSEERYRRLFETAQDGILILDAETGNIVDVNPFLIGLMGYSREEFTEKRIWEIGFFKDIIANKKNFQELKDKQYVRYENLPLETATGKTIDVEFVSNVYTVKDDKVIQCNIREISARVYTAKALEKSAKENQSLLQELQHRVKNSFTMISSMISLAAHKNASQEYKQTMEELDARVRAIAELYSLLYESGSFNEIRLDEYCASVAKGIIGLSSDTSLVTEMEAVTIPSKAALSIGLILTELITNAMKHAFPDGRKGSVSLSLRARDGRVSLEVTDDGCGLSEGFALASSAGIGLNLILGLAKQLNGDFQMDGGRTGTRCRLAFSP